MEILNEGKTRSFGKLPVWMADALKDLMKTKAQTVLIFKRTKGVKHTAYELHNCVAKTYAKVERCADDTQVSVSVFHQEPPRFGEFFPHDWRMVISINFMIDDETWYFVSKTIINNACVPTVYSQGKQYRNHVHAFPSTDGGFYGGRILGVEIPNVKQSDFYKITIDNQCVFHIPRHVEVSKDLVVGRYLVMRSPVDFVVVNPNTFHEYFTIC